MEKPLVKAGETYASRENGLRYKVIEINPDADDIICHCNYYSWRGTMAAFLKSFVV